MPWHLDNNHPDCNGWAVVKDSDNSVAGCHKTKAKALAQMAALYASEETMDKRLGRVLSAKNESKLREALTALSEVLEQLAKDEDDTQRALRGLTTAFEQRTVPVGEVEVRADGDNPEITGYAAVFNRISQPLYGFREQIRPGAFAEATMADVRALWQHDTSRVLGRTTNGTLRLWEDNRGLGFELKPPNTQDGRDALELISRGDVDQMSFGFTVPDGGDTWTEDKSGYPLRTLERINLIEISPVTFPAYAETSVSLVMRNAPEWVQRALTLGVEPIEDKGSSDARARLALLHRRLKLLTFMMEDKS